MTRATGLNARNFGVNGTARERARSSWPIDGDNHRGHLCGPYRKKIKEKIYFLTRDGGTRSARQIAPTNKVLLEAMRVLEDRFEADAPKILSPRIRPAV